MKRLLPGLIVLSVLFIVLLSAEIKADNTGGQVLWVAQNDPQADDNNPGSEELPWKTLHHALDMAQPGDTVKVKAGTYIDENSDWQTGFVPAHSGTAEAPIIFQGVPSRAPVIQAYDDGTDTAYPAWCVRSRSYIIIDGFTIKNGPLKAIECSYIEFRNNEVIGGGWQGSDRSLNWGISVQWADNSIIRNNYVHDMRDSENNAHNTACIMNLCSSNVLIEYNTADAGSGVVYSAFGQKGGGIEDSIWRNNLALNAQVAFLGMGSTDETAYSRNCTFKNNISVDCQTFLALDHNCDGFKVFNNSAVNGDYFIWGGYNAVAAEDNNSNIELWNNLYYNMPVLYRQGGSGSNDWDYLINYSDYNGITDYACAWWEGRSTLTLNDWQSETSFDTHSVNVTDDPFQDSPSGNLHLKEGSSLLANGIDRQDYDSDGNISEAISPGAYITGNEQIGHDFGNSSIYYVSPETTSTDWAAARDINTPCTVATAFKNAEAGDTVYFRGGTYIVPPRNTGTWLSGYYNPSNSGTEGNPIVFMAYPGETPVFDGTTGGSADTDGHGYQEFATIFGINDYINTSNHFKEYIVYDGFTLQADGGTAEARVSLARGDNYYSGQRGRGIVIKNCTFNGGTNITPPHDEGGTGDNREGLFVSQLTGLKISNCRFFNYQHKENNHNTSAIKTYHSDHVIVENCEIYNSTIGVFYKSNTDDSEVKYNYIHDCWQGILSGGYGWWKDSSDHSKGYYINESTNLKIYHNILTNFVRESISIQNGDGTSSHGMYIYNNTIYSGNRESVSVNLECGTDQHFYNNILYGLRVDGDIGLLRWSSQDNNEDEIADGKPRVLLEIESEDHNQFGDFDNNFLIRTRIPDSGYISYSSLSDWQNSTALNGNRHPGEGDLVSNPEFLNLSGNMNKIEDFALSETSPCRGAGRDNKDMGADISQVGVRKLVISKRPESKAVIVGDTVSFEVEAEGSPEPTYQWYHDNNIMMGETSPVLTLTEVDTDDAGEYKVEVSNTETITCKVTLTVLESPLPVINLNCTPEYYSAHLTWINPAGQGQSWDKVLVVRKTGNTPPAEPGDGVQIYNGIGENAVDRNISEDIYSYAVYTYKDTDSNDVYSEARTVSLEIPGTFNKSVIRINSGIGLDNNLIIGQNTRGDLYTLWNTDKFSLGRGPGGKETCLWIYSDISGNNENQIPLGSKIISARLVFNVEDSKFNSDGNSSIEDAEDLNMGKRYNNFSRSINAYMISDPDQLGQPYYADESGIRVGLDFNYRDHRPGMNIPWLNSPEGNNNSSEYQKRSIMTLISSLEPIDSIEFNPEVFEDDNDCIIQFDITEAVKSWVEGIEGTPLENQGLYITIGQGWQNSEELKLSGASAGENIDQGAEGELENGLIRPYIEIIYADLNTAGDLTPPDSVKDLEIIPGSDSITLNWTNPDLSTNSDMEGIKILRRKAITPFNYQDGELAAVLTERSGDSGIPYSYIDTGLTAGKTYYYAIYTYDEKHNYSEKVWIKGTPGSLSGVPANFTLTGGEGTVNLGWDTLNGAESYRIYRYDWPTNSDDNSAVNPANLRLIKDIETGEGSRFTYTDHILAGRYIYYIAAVNQYGEGPLSTGLEVTVDSSAGSGTVIPLGLRGKFSSAEVELGWDNISVETDAASYVVERKTDSIDWEEIAPIERGITEYIDKDIDSNTSYTYRIKIKISGSIYYSGEVRVDVAGIGVSDISWQVISASQIKLEWKDSPDTGSYQLDLLDAGYNILDTQLVSQGTQYFYFISLEPDKEYRVRITYTSSNDNSISIPVESDIIRTSADAKGGLF